jgi:parvulin-like peptidyl-prolyl isomerase
MNKIRIFFLLTLTFVVLAAGCGGEEDSESVPADAIAVVDGSAIAKTEFNGLINQAKKSYTAQKREFPKVGTAEYNVLKNQAVQFLVQRAQFEQKADELGVEVTDKQIEDRLKQIKKQYFGDDQKRYEQQLKQQGLTDEQVRRDIRAQLVQEGIFEEVTKDVKVGDQEIQAYYNKTKAQYGTPESREVRHILVSGKKLADELYTDLKGGADFAALAKKHSKDPGSKDQGGKLTVSRGQTVEPFDKTAFLLPKDGLSRPVKTQYGYHIIQALGDIKPAKTTPLKDVKASIKTQLEQTEKNEAMTKWVDDTKKEFADETTYQVGFAPPKTASASTSTGGSETTD